MKKNHPCQFSDAVYAVLLRTRVPLSVREIMERAGIADENRPYVASLVSKLIEEGSAGVSWHRNPDTGKEFRRVTWVARDVLKARVSEIRNVFQKKAKAHPCQFSDEVYAVLLRTRESLSVNEIMERAGIDAKNRPYVASLVSKLIEAGSVDVRWYRNLDTGKEFRRVRARKEFRLCAPRDAAA